MRNRILLVLFFCGLMASASAQSKFNRFIWNAGVGLGSGRQDVADFVGNSSFVVAGGGMKLNRFFSVDAEYMYYNLGFRQSVKQNQFLNGQSGHMQSISLDGIVNVPKHLYKIGAYGIFGIGFYDRSVSVPGFQVTGATQYQSAWKWWDLKWENDRPGTRLVTQWMSSNSKIAGGFNYGGGITYPLHNKTKIYMEWRYHRAYQSDSKTIVMPFTVGLRW